MFWFVEVIVAITRGEITVIFREHVCIERVCVDPALTRFWLQGLHWLTTTVPPNSLPLKIMSPLMLSSAKVARTTAIKVK